MANKSIYQEYNQDALDHFGLDEHTSDYGVCSNSSGVIETIKCTEDVTSFENIKNILETETIKSITTEKRAFIIPKCPISGDRIKAALKEAGVVVTNDFTAADLVVTHHNVEKYYRNGDNIQSTILMGKLWNYDVFKDCRYMTSGREYVAETDNGIIYDDKVSEFFNSYNIDIHETMYESWMISGLAVNLAHRIDTEGLSVMEADSVLNSSATKTVLTEDMVELLTTQINSYNDEDQQLGAKILPTIDYTQNYHLLWDLAQKINGSLYKFNRNKDVKYWEKVSNIADHAYRSAEDMILWLEDNELLTIDSFRYLEPIVRKEIQIHNRNLYVFKVQVKPEYRKFLKRETNGVTKEN
ncbi:MAG: hypothetical protein CMH79_05315 [Nitrospinae bacterium]|nr:hypothetical protein [Nitrospinota bacterium]